MSAAAEHTEPADLAVHAAWVIPVEPDAQTLEQHCVVIRDGRIVALLPSAAARRRFAARETVELPAHVLTPGFVNAHTRAASALLRGLGNDPGRSRAGAREEPRWASAALARDGSELGIACMLRSGTTCFGDAGYFPDMTAETSQHTGVRANLGMVVADFASAWAGDAREYLAKGMAVRDQYRNDPQLSFAFAPKSAWNMPESLLREIRALSDELDAPIQARLHATAAEVEQCRKQYAQRPLARLAASGWLTPNFNAVHATELNDEDIGTLARAGAHVIHCPEASLRLAGGFCPVARLLEAGINVALGTGGAATGTTLDMLQNMRSAALFATSQRPDASPLPAATVLRMATLNGASALGLDAHTGSLVPGKWADMVAVDLNAPETQPLYNPLSQLVNGASNRQVTDVWVAGEALLRKGEFTRLDLGDVLRRARGWQTRIAAAAPGATE